MSGRGALRGGLALTLLGAAAIGVGLACIIPDRDIQVRTTETNLYPVRFVEGIPLLEEARCACSEDTCECPLPEFTAVPTFLDPTNPTYQFCICQEGKIDPKRLQAFQLYVEDQDEVDGEPDDLLYAVALLDWDPTLQVPAFDYVAYRSYLDPNVELNPYPGTSYESLILKRPRPYVRAVEINTLVDDGKIDLCNGAGRPVEPGFHTLSFMVTDRPWFRLEPDGGGDTGSDGMPVSFEGVPDIAAGATYDIQTYVFQCLQEMDGSCVCDDPDQEG